MEKRSRRMRKRRRTRRSQRITDAIIRVGMKTENRLNNNNNSNCSNSNSMGDRPTKSHRSSFKNTLSLDNESASLLDFGVSVSVSVYAVSTFVSVSVTIQRNPAIAYFKGPVDFIPS